MLKFGQEQNNFKAHQNDIDQFVSQNFLLTNFIQYIINEFTINVFKSDELYELNSRMYDKLNGKIAVNLILAK